MYIVFNFIEHTCLYL